MMILRAMLVAALGLLLCAAGEPAAPQESGAAAPAVGWVRIADAIQPATADFLQRTLDWSARRGQAALVVELDTPGGLDASMRTMVKAILASPVPVIVYVAPPGSRAASAGVFLMMAAHVAAMAPGTNLGAAHPVALGGGLPGGGEGAPDTTMVAKVTNDAVAYVRSLAERHGRNADWVERAVRESVSLPAEEAHARNVIDLVAANREALLAQVADRAVTVVGGERRLPRGPVRWIEREMTLRDRVLSVIANPNVAYLLLLLGALGIFFELSNPGALFPGIVGGLALLLAFFGLQMLPVRGAGIALILLSIIFFLLEIKVTSYGALSIAGVAALLFGSLMLYESSIPALSVSLGVVLPSVIVVALLFLLVVYLAVRSQTTRRASGADGLVGEIGLARSDLAPEGRVFVHGEVWQARSRQPIRSGERVRVLRVRGLWLEVEAAGAPPFAADPPPGR